MKHQTYEAQDEMEKSFVIDFLNNMMQREISNPVSYRRKALLVNLSNHAIVRVIAPKVPRNTQPPNQTEAQIHNFATLRYILQHDYGYGKEPEQQKLNKLELHNLDECRTYIEDVINNQLNAYFTNGLIEFMNGEKFMISIELKH